VYNLLLTEPQQQQQTVIVSTHLKKRESGGHRRTATSSCSNSATTTFHTIGVDDYSSVYTYLSIFYRRFLCTPDVEQFVAMKELDPSYKIDTTWTKSSNTKFNLKANLKLCTHCGPLFSVLF
jgi:hypothetical protein